MKAERFHASEPIVDVVPTIISLREHLERIRHAELSRLRRRLGALTPEQELAINAMTRGIVNKLMQTATDALKNGTREPQLTSLLELVRHLFGLHEPAPGDQWINDGQFVSAGS